MNYACIKDGVVVNSITLEDPTGYDYASVGYDSLVPSDAVIGSTYTDGVFTPPVSPAFVFTPAMLISKALIDLGNSDIQVARASECQVPLDPAWIEWRTELRLFIKNKGAGTYPVKPPYPTY